ncbi:MAG: class I SAM-dependent methyltransferase [Cyclobacteriaceae bacterium]|nr:class I SAM-dependent methyltransferase [Cyclobacteriaceae bacterium]
MRFERCGELPYILSVLEPYFDQELKYLDIGTGNSTFPSFLLKKTKWDITCLDKFSWMQMQHSFAEKVMDKDRYEHRFHVVEKDFLAVELPPETYDIITNISVIEHFEGASDSLAMAKSARLLKPGGIYILSTPVNDGFHHEFYIKEDVYGEKYDNKPVFFQRHYSVESFFNRIVLPSGLQEKQRIYMGEYGFQFKEIFLDPPALLKPLKIFYQWAVPFFAKQFISYRNYPVSRPKMKIYTSSAVISVLQK